MFIFLSPVIFLKNANCTKKKIGTFLIKNLALYGDFVLRVKSLKSKGH